MRSELYWRALAPYLSVDRLVDVAFRTQDPKILAIIRDPSHKVWSDRTWIELGEAPVLQVSARYYYLTMTDNWWGKMFLAIGNNHVITKARVKGGYINYAPTKGNHWFFHGIVHTGEGLKESYRTKKIPHGYSLEKFIIESILELFELDPQNTHEFPNLPAVKQVLFHHDKIFYLGTDGSLWTSSVSESHYSRSFRKVVTQSIRYLKPLGYTSYMGSYSDYAIMASGEHKVLNSTRFFSLIDPADFLRQNINNKGLELGLYEIETGSGKYYPLYKDPWVLDDLTGNQGQELLLTGNTDLRRDRYGRSHEITVLVSIKGVVYVVHKKDVQKLFDNYRFLKYSAQGRYGVVW